MRQLRQLILELIPPSIFRALQSPYHFLLALFGALWYRFPSRRMLVIGVTGTKGKSTTAELINATFEEAGFSTALANTIRFKIGVESRQNRFKMTMPGRFFLQKFLRQAVDASCSVAILEMTSEGVKQSRHKFIALDALVFTNLSPEHIESHGSFENYAAAKLKLAQALARSPKRKRVIVANADDPFGERFLAEASPAEKHPFRLEDANPFTLGGDGIDFQFAGAEMHSPLIGAFNLYNLLAAASLAESFGIGTETIVRAFKKVARIPGRVEYIANDRAFSIIVDYAHTADSLRALYEAFPNIKKICVLGATGGGRDQWKRSLMGKVADQYCAHAIVTDEDPYDEDPSTITMDVAKGFSKLKPEIIIDRRAAIRRALTIAKKGDAVLITGKGTDPYIMKAYGEKLPWSDAAVAREELALLPRL